MLEGMPTKKILGKGIALLESFLNKLFFYFCFLKVLSQGIFNIYIE